LNEALAVEAKISFEKEGHYFSAFENRMNPSFLTEQLPSYHPLISVDTAAEIISFLVL